MEIICSFRNRLFCLHDRNHSHAIMWNFSFLLFASRLFRVSHGQSECACDLFEIVRNIRPNAKFPVKFDYKRTRGERKNATRKWILIFSEINLHSNCVSYSWVPAHADALSVAHTDTTRTSNIELEAKLIQMPNTCVYFANENDKADAHTHISLGRSFFPMISSVSTVWSSSALVTSFIAAFLF